MANAPSANSFRTAAIALAVSAALWSGAVNVLNQKYGTSIPDWTILVAIYIAAAFLLYWAWHTEFVQRRRGLIYTYPRMTLAFMIVTGMMLGGGAAGILWWTIQREQRAARAQSDHDLQASVKDTPTPVLPTTSPMIREATPVPSVSSVSPTPPAPTPSASVAPSPKAAAPPPPPDDSNDSMRSQFEAVFALPETEKVFSFQVNDIPVRRYSVTVKLVEKIGDIDWGTELYVHIPFLGTVYNVGSTSPLTECAQWVLGNYDEITDTAKSGLEKNKTRTLGLPGQRLRFTRTVHIYFEGKWDADSAKYITGTVAAKRQLQVKLHGEIIGN